MEEEQERRMIEVEETHTVEYEGDPPAEEESAGRPGPESQDGEPQDGRPLDDDGNPIED